MPGPSNHSGPSHQSGNIDHSHHETSYGGYTNHGYHASDGGIMNFNNCQFSLVEEPENQSAVVSSIAGFYPNHERSLPKRRLTSSGASVEPSQSKRQRVADFVKMTLDIAKESADFGDPLKAALAGVGALFEHYEDFEGVKDKIDDLQFRLRQNITTTTIDRDPEESTRQTELISTLGQIEKRSQKLLQKGHATQFVDKRGDSGEVVSLVEQFQQALSHYRISQHKAIYDSISSLTSSFNTLLKLQENSPAVKKKLDSVMARLDQLCSAEDCADDNEHERWAKLFNKLRFINTDGKVLYNRINAQDYKECGDDIHTASRIAEDIRDALLDYQISQQRAIFDQNCKLINPADLFELNTCRCARGAAYQHGNRRGCLRGTREVVLDEIESWTKEFDKSPIFWLNGLAGTGKSTIAQTISERAFADGTLGASFFCSRDFEDRSDLHFIFPTLAIQLARQFSSFRDHLVPLLRSNPQIVEESLYSQMERLIVEPLRTAEISTVIVVDALDECKDDEPSSAILSVLGRFVKQIPRVKFFITGRPEPRIKSGFRLPLLEDATNVFVLHDVHPDLINNDIRLFLKHELSEIAKRRRQEGWPSDEHVNLLCQRAAGLFVYAVATVKFLDSRHHLPQRRLDVIVKLPECTTPEGKTQFKPSLTLDSLYMSVLQTAFSEEDPEVDSKVRSIIGAVVLFVNPLPPSGIAELTDLDSQEVILLLTSVQSLLNLDEDPTQPVKSFHKSFPDFVTDPSRCTDTRFYISPEILHLQLAMNCLKVLNDGLEQNLLDLPDYALNSEVLDLQMRIDGRINVALRYACQSWHNHLHMFRGDVADIMESLRFFLEGKFLAWLEVLSVLKATKGAVVALEKLMSWLQEVSGDNPLLDTARGCLYFVTEFFEPINASATHIYHSALELSPLLSIVRKLHHHRRLSPLPGVETGIPDSRDPSITILTAPSRACWSPCGQFVATTTVRGVAIRDAQTFELVSTLQPATDVSFYLTSAYSPDGHSLACATGTGITIWDIQTGGVALTTEWENRPWQSSEEQSLAWSEDGRVVGVQSNNWGAYMYDVVSDTTTMALLDSTQYSAAGHLWAHKDSFRVMRLIAPPRPLSDFWQLASVGGQTTWLEIFEVSSALTLIESFSIQSEEWAEAGSFSPTTYRFSSFVSNPPRLVIFDIRNSKTLLDEKGFFYPISHSFSSDGSRFAAHRPGGIHIWNFDGSLYIPWRQFPSPNDMIHHPILFSPTSSSILANFGSTHQLWRLDSPPTAPATNIPQLNIFSRSGTQTATTRYKGSTITITNVVPQSASQFIDTGFKVAGLGLTGNVLLVRGPRVVVAWLLTEEGCVSNVLSKNRAGRKESIWTMVTVSQSTLKFSIAGETGVVKSGKTLHIFNLKTGEVLEPTQELPNFSGPWYSFTDKLQAQEPCCTNPAQNASSKGDWKPTLAEEWLKDYQGKRLLWLPVEWRGEGKVEWFPDISTMKFKSRDEKPVIIKLH